MRKGNAGGTHMVRLNPENTALLFECIETAQEIAGRRKGPGLNQQDIIGEALKAQLGRLKNCRAKTQDGGPSIA